MDNQSPLNLVYTTRGDVGAYLSLPYLFNSQGEWIGWVSLEGNVYTVDGHYVGRLTADPRIIRPREVPSGQPLREPPPPPQPVRVPGIPPLAPQLSELPQNWIDVLDDAPELLPTVDADSLRPDLD